MDFKGKNILVAGGSAGIGLALIKQLSAAGANIINVSRNASDEWPPNVKHIGLDVLGDLCSLESQLPEKLHGLVYSIGSINLKPFHRLTKDDYINDYQINVISATEVIKQSLKSLRNSGGASVILYSSVAAKTGMGFHASIAAAKGAVEGLTLSLAAELAPLNIRVNAIAPSLTDTRLVKNLLSTDEKRMASAKRHPLGKYGEANDIAAATRFLLSDESSWITGQIIGIDGGLSVIRPL